MRVHVINTPLISNSVLIAGYQKKFPINYVIYSLIT